MKKPDARPTTCPVSEGEVGAILRAARLKSGMARKQLAQTSGTSERYLALLESGEGNPTLSVLIALSQALDLSLAELLPLGGERDAPTATLVGLVRHLSFDRQGALEAWLREERATTPATTRDRRVILIGLRGAGKSSLGKRLADLRGVPFVEMTSLVEDAYGDDIGQLIERNGYAALHRYERAAWQDICRTHRAAVIAVPGGIVADPDLYDEMLTTAYSVWLKASADDHMARVIAEGGVRAGAAARIARDDLESVLDARSPDYARTQLHFDTSGLAFDMSLTRLAEQVDKVMADPRPQPPLRSGQE